MDSTFILSEEYSHEGYSAQEGKQVDDFEKYEGKDALVIDFGISFALQLALGDLRINHFPHIFFN